MLNKIYRFVDYILYFFTSKNLHGVHSPFVYWFNQHIINAKNGHPAMEQIEVIRRNLIQSKAQIDIVDLGSGKNNGPRNLGTFVWNVSRKSKYTRLLYRILIWQKPQFAIELGTAAGISGLYQALALSPENPLITIEGSPKLTEIAKYNAIECGLENNMRFFTGNFDEALPSILNQIPHIDYCYIDGNHKSEPTYAYFELLLQKVHSNSILIFDDINWSSDMQSCWKQIKNHPSVKITIDLFEFGIVFFRTENAEKEHFVIRF